MPKSTSQVFSFKEENSDDENPERKKKRWEREWNRGDDQLSPEDEATLEEEATKYHEHDWDLLANARAPDYESVANLHKTSKTTRRKASLRKTSLDPIKNTGFKGTTWDVLKDVDLTFNFFAVTSDDEWGEVQ